MHRDVSPSNVLISRAGSVKLVDFGIAKPIGAASGGTTTGVLKGKVGYMAPEQVRGEPLDRRCDIFALGIVLYEMTTGRRCFYADSMFEVLNLSARAEIISPREHVAEYPEDLERIVIRALARDADGRFATAAELQEALEEFALAHRLKISSRIVSEFLSEAMPQDEAAVRRARGAAEPERPTATALIPSTEDEQDPSAPLGVGNTEPRARGSARGWVTAAAILAAGVTGWVFAPDRSAPRSVRPLLAPVPYAAALPQASVAAVPELKTPLPPEASPKPAASEAVPTPKTGHRKKKRQKRPPGRTPRAALEIVMRSYPRPLVRALHDQTPDWLALARLGPVPRTETVRSRRADAKSIRAQPNRTADRRASRVESRADRPRTALDALRAEIHSRRRNPG